MEPFKALPPKASSGLQRLLSRQPRENAFIEINNLLAQAEHVQDVTVEDLKRVAIAFDLDPYREFQKELLGLWSEYLRHCLFDTLLTDQEVEDLAYLKRLFALEEVSLLAVQSELVASTYKRSVEEALRDGRMSPEESQFLDKLQRDLKLRDEIATKLLAAEAEGYVSRYLKSSVSDERLSPDEEAEIDAIAASLGVKKVTYEEKTKALLDRYRLYWQIDYGNLPQFDADINLRRGETCHFASSAEWYEERRVTRRIRYGGPTMRIRIAKGLYWRMGDLGVQSVSEDILAHIDSGKLYLTNRRVVFLGNRKSRMIQLSRILDFNPYRNGVEIAKGSGKNPFLQFVTGADIFALMLGRLLREQR